MKCREYSWEISDGTGPLTLLLTRHSLWPPRSETAINPAAAPEMLETEALKKVVIISGCAHEHPNKSGFQETKYPPCITVRWNAKQLAEKSSSSKYCCYETPRPGFSKKTSGSNANFTSQDPASRCCACVMEPSAQLVTPVPHNSGAAIAKQEHPNAARGAPLWSPTSSLGPPFLSSNTPIFSFWYPFQCSQAAPERNLLEGPFLQGHSWRKWEVSHTEIHHFAARVCTFWSPLGCEGKDGSREAQPCQDGSAWEHPKQIFGHLGKLDIENIGTHVG